MGDEEAKMTFWVPPEGTKRGDTLEGDVRLGFRFSSPEGEVRGIAKMHTVPLALGKEIRDKVEEILKTL